MKGSTPANNTSEGGSGTGVVLRAVTLNIRPPRPFRDNSPRATSPRSSKSLKSRVVGSALDENAISEESDK